MKNEAYCPSEDARIHNLVVAKSAEIWNTVSNAIMQSDLHTAQIYTVADNLLNELVMANETDIEHAVMEMKSTIRASLRREEDVFQLQKQVVALGALIDLLQAIHNDDQQEKSAYALAK